MRRGRAHEKDSGFAACAVHDSVPVCLRDKDDTPTGGQSSQSGENSEAVYTAEKPLVLKFTWAGTADDVRGQPFQRMAEAVEERSGGSIRCEFRPGNELGGAADTVEMISGGANILQTVSADFTSDYGCPDMMLCNIFYTFDSVEKTLEFSNSDIFKGMCDKVAEGGIKVLDLAWIEAPRQLMSTRPVQSFADLKGLKVRVPGFVYADFWDACGAVGTSVGLSDAYSALSSGILEATETNLESLYSYSMQEVCPYCTLTAHTTAPGCFLMSQKIWEELTPEQQTIMSEEAYNAGLWFSEQQLEGQDIAKKALEEAGVTFYTLSEEDMAALKQVALEQVKSYVTTYDLTDSLYEQIVAFLADRPTFTDPQNGSRRMVLSWRHPAVAMFPSDLR